MAASPAKQEILDRLRSSIAAVEAGVSLGNEEGGREASSFSASCRTEVETEGEAASFSGESTVCPDKRSRSSADQEVGEEKTADDAYRQILRWVSVRERSTSYLRERLLKAEYAPEYVEEALERACRVYVVDDRRYADSLIRMKLAAGRGLRDAEREIAELGIDPSTLDSWQEHEALGREADIERALGVLRRRPPRAKNQREAAYRRLISQGYGSDVASTAARLWTEQQ